MMSEAIVIADSEWKQLFDGCPNAARMTRTQMPSSLFALGLNRLGVAATWPSCEAFVLQRLAVVSERSWDGHSDEGRPPLVTDVSFWDARGGLNGQDESGRSSLNVKSLFAAHALEVLKETENLFQLQLQ